MYKTSVYTLVNGDMQWMTHRKQQKIRKRWYYSTAHWQLGDVMVSDITLFSMCHSLHVAVNNWCFVHLYLLFYYNNKVFMLMVNYKPLCFPRPWRHRTLNILGSKFWSLGVTWRYRNVTIRLGERSFLLVGGRRGVVVTCLIRSAKLLYAGPG